MEVFRVTTSCAVSDRTILVTASSTNCVEKDFLRFAGVSLSSANSVIGQQVAAAPMAERRQQSVVFVEVRNFVLPCTLVQLSGITAMVTSTLRISSVPAKTNIIKIMAVMLKLILNIGPGLTEFWIDQMAFGQPEHTGLNIQTYPFVKPRGFGQSEIRSIRCLPN